MKKFILIGLFLFFIYIIIPQSVLAAESYSRPTSGWIGYIFKSPTTYCSGDCHTGIDIWSNPNGLWNSDGSSNPIYGVYPGFMYAEDVNGYYIKNTNNLYSIFYHVRDRKLTTGQYVDSSTLIGYQDMNVTVHLHLSISTAAADAYSIDPSAYLGMNLNYENSGHIGFLTTQVTYSECGGGDVVKSNWSTNGPFDCIASHSITINPNSTINSTGGNVRFHIQ